MLVAFGLRALARWQLAVALADAAAQRIALVQAGRSPYAWGLRDRGDLIAGRVFGANDVAVDSAGLHLALSAQGIEIGLPLHGERIDLARFDRLQLSLDRTAPVEIDLALRERLDAGEIRAPLPLALSSALQRFDLARLDWQDPHGQAIAAPTRAASLRLRLRSPTAATATLRDVALLPRPALQAAGLLARSRGGARDAGMPRAGEDLSRLPLIAYAGERSNEAVLALRDASWEQQPAALVVPRNRLENLTRAMASDSRRPVLPWLALAGLVALLAAVRWRPPKAPRQKAALELAVVIAPLEFLVLDGRIGDDLGLPLGLAGIALLGFAASLPRLADWRWLGDWRSAILPLCTLGLATAVALRYGDHCALRGPGMVLRYVVWAAAQQFLLCTVVADRLRRLLPGDELSALAAATLFALLHAPNESLMLATFTGGLLWTAAWLRHRRLLPLVVAHALGALLLFATLPPAVLRSAEVSARYFSP